MPIYEVETPTGQVLEIEGPEGADETQILQVAREYISAASSPASAPVAEEQGPGVVDRLAGPGEAALAAATGATTGTLGYLGGVLKQLAEEIITGGYGTQEGAQRVQQAAEKGMSALTYAPRSETGGEILETVGKVAEPLAAIAPLAEMSAISQGVRGAAVPTMAAAERGGQRTVQGAQQIVENIRPQAPSPTQSLSAAEVADATLRQAKAQELPVPVDLTKGQATRQFEDVRFERETAKDAERGQALRERFSQQNEQLVQNIDSFVDETGATLGEGRYREVGELIDKALVDRLNKDKERVNVLYKEAEKAGELQDSVDMTEVIKLLNDSTPAESTAPIIRAAKAEAVRLGLAKGSRDEDGNLILESVGEVTDAPNVNSTEQLRKFINSATNQTNGPDIHYAGQIKELIDQSTEGKGGELYKKARSARRKMAIDYEEPVLVRQLLGTKPGSQDRIIALENVVDRIVFSQATSKDQVVQLRRLLQTKTGGPEGQGAQAWREVQGAALRKIQEQITKNMQIDQQGNRVVSPAALDKVIRELDNSGKLEMLFGKKGAEQLRTLNEVAQSILTVPPGSVNTSNTATVLAGLMDVAITGSTGIPAPLASSVRYISSQVKDAKLKAKIREHLGEVE